jgi:hypothetical protein
MVICDTLASSQCNTRSQQGAERGTGESRCAITTPTPPHTPTAETSRLFATDLVNSGLPIHIGAKLLGHLDLQTTQGYVAVFEEDLVRHYQDSLARRRAQRPADEYTTPTKVEWSEFEEHFDRRKVELGSCGRPYGTPCQHEHACVRCPLLTSIRRCCRVWSNWNGICVTGAAAPSTKAGPVRSRAST